MILIWFAPETKGQALRMSHDIRRFRFFPSQGTIKTETMMIAAPA